MEIALPDDDDNAEDDSEWASASGALCTLHTSHDFLGDESDDESESADDEIQSDELAALREDAVHIIQHATGDDLREQNETDRQFDIGRVVCACMCVCVSVCGRVCSFVHVLIVVLRGCVIRYATSG